MVSARAGPPPGAPCVGGELVVGADGAVGVGAGTGIGCAGGGGGTSAVSVGLGGSRGGAVAPDLASSCGSGPVPSHNAKPPRPTNTITASGARSRADARRTMSQAAIPAGKAIDGPHHSSGKARECARGTVVPNTSTNATHNARNSRQPVTTRSQRGACPASVGALGVIVIGRTLTG